MRIGLVHSSNKDFSESQNYGLKFAPVWAFVLSSYIKREGFKAFLYDLNVYKQEIIEPCDAYFLSGINQDLEEIQKVASYLRLTYPGIPIFLGGPIAWSFDQADELDKLSLCDHICIGDTIAFGMGLRGGEIHKDLSSVIMQLYLYIYPYWMFRYRGSVDKNTWLKFCASLNPSNIPLKYGSLGNKFYYFALKVFHKLGIIVCICMPKLIFDFILPILHKIAKRKMGGSVSP